MHQAALLGEGMKDAASYGWEVPEEGPKHNWETMVDAASYGWEVPEEGPKHNWETMVNAVVMHVKSLNFGYRAELMSAAVKYYNAYATFKDEKTVVCVDKKGKETTVTADNFVIAVGGRPRYPDIPGARE